jgi:hypothetical protein
MKSPAVTSGRKEKTTAGWIQGVNSVRNPWALPENQLKWGLNVTIRGGIAQTRPGFNMKLSLPPGNFQGGSFFASNKQYQASQTTTSTGQTSVSAATIYNYDGAPSTEAELYYVVFAVSGKVYFSPFPLTQPKNWEDYRLTNIQLDSDVDQFVFTVGTKSASISVGGDVSITPAYRILLIQDGINSPAYWDGSNTTGGQSSKIPVGTWMAFSGERLWIASKNIVLASDLGDPLSWQERVTGAGRGDFSFPRPITGMVSYVGQNTDTRLVVFTDRSTYSLASGVLDRTQWSTTSAFQNTLFPTVGCIAGKSIAFQAGQMWWYSQGGLVAADVAAASYLSSQVLYKDVEMARAKQYTAPNLSTVCATAFENYLLYSLPYLEPLNSATMVLDYAAASEWSQAKVPAWCGTWTGIRPVEWINGLVNSNPKCFAFSVDYSATSDGSYNSLWEAFSEHRVDSYLDIQPDGTALTRYNRIYSQIETALLGDGMDNKQFAYAEVDATQIGGTVDVKVSFRGSKGSYQPVLSTRLLAVTEDYQWKTTPFADQISELGLLNTQFRRLITESYNRNINSTTCESTLTNDIDKAHSILIEWCGEFGVEIVRIYQDPWTDKSTGIPQTSETTSCVVGQDGSNTTLDLLPSPYSQPPTEQTSWFASAYQTVTSTCQSPSVTPSASATAKASYLSYISYDDALNRATDLAYQAAYNAVTNFRAQHPCTNA